ncbi:FAD-dependent thymidylate synthase [Truepera radiovictrix]|uniref:Flavin-dependent thymidylate synthase n=1 Tax=Truepera radiovictrix (strain DSM 17093 / CIP 108686 / LMG 22925 / RQ-24) TaxID=649638 RepID=D7CWT8_TRURR|nr:FAD-dependent thymidylate synthase [Truepera radiovictrix]ADI13179.1 thymidylate synthase, flavin-dependent [Truepera radiovictrix DSM 17093]WMT58252.1 FAD-dependent thymidylate synthase [Truepera radiovictrix]
MTPPPHAADDPQTEPLLDREYRVLDKGFVRLVDHMGGDARIVQAARVSYGAGTKSTREDAQLIDYLMRQGHTSPFEQVVMTFHLKMPLFVARQWLRHRTARVNELSGRYSVLRDEFYVPEALRGQDESNKQGSAGALGEEANAQLLAELVASQARAYDTYEALLEAGVARELARINLPLSLYTEFYWQIDLHNLFHFLKLRLDPHAQREIRMYAEALLAFAKGVAPVACAAFEEHVLCAKTFSRGELELLRAAIDSGALQAALETSDLRASRRRELLEKLGFADAQRLA